MRHLHRFTPLWIALLSLGISGIIALTTPLPQPQFHDEFSYLLAADTFAKGRLANPPHRLWEFFETFHVIHQPTYASKYPPGQGLMLALGRVAFGHPIAGVWLSTALACAAMWWALRAFMPGKWALVGALLAATHPMMLAWNHSYWGGSVPAAGGALALGGIARLRRGGIGAGLGLGGGIFILAISRPFEGIIFLMLSLLMLRLPLALPSPRGRRDKGGCLIGTRKTAVVALGVLVLGACWIGYYNWRITQRPWRMPYMEYENTYAITAPFVWMPRSENPPTYRHEAMRKFYQEFWLDLYRNQRTVAGFVAESRNKLWKLTSALLLPVGLIVPLLVLPLAIRRDRMLRRALVAATIFTLIVMGHLGFFPHYTAPAATLYLLVLVQCLRHIRAGLRPWGGRWLARGVVVAQVLVAVGWIIQLDRSAHVWNFYRADFIAHAAQTGQKRLVFVRPGPGFNPHVEWVFNDADIDASPVVWARDMGSQNERILSYFPDRTVYFLDIDAQTMRFTERRN